MDTLAQTEGLLGDLIAFPTVSADSNLELIGWVSDLLIRLGAEVDITRDPTGTKANLFATFGPTVPGGLVLSGHSDVVPVEGQDWASDPFEMTARDDLLFGRGACDMKGFIACVLALAPDIARWRLARPVHIALTYDEETGCFGAQALVASLQARGIRPALAIVGEPTQMQVITGHKGCYEYATRISGCEGHGSAPDLGVNAAVAAARYAARLSDLESELKTRAPADSPFEPPWSTINIGRIAAGVATNVIPGKAEIDWEMRPVTPADAEFVLAEIDGFAEHLLPRMHAVDPSCTIIRDVVAEIAGLQPATPNRAAEVVTALTGANGTGVVSFGTEAGLFQAMGMDCVVCGPGSIEQAHKPDEFVARSELLACIDMLRGLEGKLA